MSLGRCCLGLVALLEPVLLIALMIMRHAKLSFGDHVPYLRMLFGTQKGCIGHCLIVGRGGRFDLLKV